MTVKLYFCEGLYSLMNREGKFVQLGSSTSAVKFGPYEGAIKFLDEGELESLGSRFGLIVAEAFG